MITSLRGGGAERVVVNLAQWWANQGVSVAIVTLFGSEHDAYHVPKSVKRVALDLSQPSVGVFDALRANVTRVRALRKTLRSLAPTTVVGFLTETNVLSILASVGMPQRVLVAERIHPPRHSIPTQWRWLRKLTYRWCDAAIAQTGQTAEWLRLHTGCRRVLVIPNSVNWPLHQIEPMLAPHSLLPPNHRLLLGVGRLTEQKGFDLLIQAFAQVADEFPHWNLGIVGEEEIDSETPHARVLTALVDRLGLKDRVVFTGRIGNLDTWYQRCDVFVLSSRYEGFPNVLLEAMAAGCAVAAFDCETGPADIVEQDINGVLVPAADVSAMAGALRGLMNDEKRRLAMGHQALGVRNRFAPEIIMQQWHEASGLAPIAPNDSAH